MRRLTVLLSLVCLSNTLLFSQGKGKPKTPVPVITGVEVFFDPTPGALLISGLNFDETVNSPIEATLFVPGQGETPLTVINFDAVNQEILAELPVGIQNTPGTFLLKVTALGIVSDGFPATIGQRILGYERIRAESAPLTLGPNGGGSMTVQCSAGKRVLGGGGVETTELVTLVRSYPPTEASWSVLYRNLTDTTVVGTVLQVFAICATAE